MAEEPNNDAESFPGKSNETSLRGRKPGSIKAMRDHAIKKGEVRNKEGANGWTKAKERFRKFALEVQPDGLTRDDHILLATYDSARIPGSLGAADRKLWHEHLRGKPRQQIELSSDDGTSGVMLVPMTASLDEWEASVRAAQAKLKHEVSE